MPSDQPDRPWERKGTAVQPGAELHLRRAERQRLAQRLEGGTARSVPTGKGRPVDPNLRRSSGNDAEEREEKQGADSI